MADPFVAEIRIVPFNFAPQGWAFCNGQLLPISQNTALFSLLGTTYGGDGKSTFALPNLQGSAPMQQGQGPGLSIRDLGETGGEQTVPLLEAEMPSHRHTFQGVVSSDSATPANDALGGGGGFGRPKLYTPSSGQNVQMSSAALSVTGGGVPHNNMGPFLCLNFVIALQGVFPPRS